MVGKRAMDTICALFVWISWKLLTIVCAVVTLDENMEKNHNIVNTNISLSNVYMESNIVGNDTI